MRTVPLGSIASMRYGKLPPKEQLETGCPIFTGYRVSGYASSYLYKEPMLVVVARGVGGTGDVKISPPESWITNLSIVLDVDQEQVDKYFLCAYLGQQSLKERLDTGSAQAQITVNALEPFLVTIPPLATQRRIASILSAYNDLIENNTRRIAILEEMARRIYEEWFVRFRFPGHEQVRMVESELGLIPEGWEVKTLGDMSTYINRGLPPKYDDEASSLVINQKCIRNQRLTLDFARRQSKAEKLKDGWQLKMQTKADVERTIRDFYIKLPPAYTPQLKKDKRAMTYAHLFENYFGAGRSVYQAQASV